MFRLCKSIFYSPDPVGGTGGDSKEMGIEDTISFLNTDDDEPEVIELDPDKKIPPKTKDKIDDESDEDDKLDKKSDEKSKDDETEPEDDELQEIEDELAEPTEEQLELVTPVKRREILKKYPTLFKDFPYLETAYYREQQFTEIFPTIPEAREALEQVQTLQNFESDLMKGDTETILKAVKAQDANAFAKIADNYLSTLSKVDEKAFHHVVGNTIKQVIVQMVTEANTSKNDDLRAAAQLLNQFVFGKSEFVPPTKLASEVSEDKKDDSISQRERQFNERQFRTAQTELNTRVMNTLKNTIDRHIDPKESMTDYVKRQASRDTLESLTKLIDSDSRFKVLLTKLWQAAAKEDYSKDSVDRIRAAIVSKSKTLLPSVIKKARNEALKGIGKRVRADKDDSDEESNDSKESPTPKKRESNPQRKTGQIKTAKDIPEGMSSMDYLMADD